TQSEANDALSLAANRLRPHMASPPIVVSPASTTAAVLPTPRPALAEQPERSTPRPGRPLRSVAIGATVLGGLLIGGGVTLIARDGRTPTGTAPSAGRTYVDKLPSLGAGIGVTVGGARALTAAGILFWRDQVLQKRARPAFSARSIARGWVRDTAS